MLPELAVALSFDFVSLAAALLLARWTLNRSSSGGEARRLVNAATRASESFLWRETKHAALPTLLCVALVLAAHGVLRAHGSVSRGLEGTLWTAFAALLGSAATAMVAYTTTQLGLRTCLRTLRAAHVNSSQATAVALRGAGAAALAAEGVGASAIALLLGLEYLLGGGSVSAPERAAELLERAGTILPGLCLGSVAAASVFSLGGASYRVGAELSRLSATGLETTDPRNPSMVADLVGDHVGTSVRRAVDMFAATTLANVTTVLVGIAAFRADGGASGARAWAFVTLPLVVRGSGVLASLFGLFAARATEAERAANALWRGQTTAAVIVLGGLLGAAFWLLGNPDYLWLVAAGTVGVGAGVAVSQQARLRVNRRQQSVHEVAESARAGAAVTIARGLSHGLEGAVPPVVMVCVSMALAFQLGARATLSNGGLLGATTALASLLAVSPYMLAMGLFGPIVGGAVTVTALDPDQAEPDVKWRGAQLDEAGFDGGSAAQAFFAVLGCEAAVMVGLWIPTGAHAGRPADSFMWNPVVACSGVLGAALVGSACGRALTTAARAARGTVLEVERQLRGFPREAGVAVVPEGYTPSYRAVVELSSKLALRGALWPAVVGLLAPAALGILLRLLYTSPDLAAAGLTSFVLLAAGTGLWTTLANEGSHGVLGAAHRANRTRAGAGPDATIPAQALGSFFGEVAAPAAHLFVKTAAAAALIVAPLLSNP